MRADYECIKCNKVTEYTKPYGKDFPKTIKCSHCKKKAKRIYTSMPVVSVAEGNLGNSANGYEDTATYHPSPFTPIGKTQVGGAFEEATGDDHY